MRRVLICIFSLALLTCFGLSANADLDDGLVAYYPFEGNADDQSGNGNHGIVIGANLTSDQYGTANSAYEFDGINDYIELPSMIIGGAISIEATVLRRELYNSAERIIDLANADFEPRNNSSVSDAILIAWRHPVNGAQIFSDIIVGQNTGNSSYLWPTDTFPVNEWIHVVYVNDGNGKGYFYQNGELQISGNQATPAAVLRESNWIGRSNFQLDPFFDGIIDHLRIYDRALSEAEIRELAGIKYTEKIVWASERFGNSDIWMMNPDGTNKVQLTTDPATDRKPMISHDGSKIAFASERTGRNEIWVMDVDGGNKTQLTFDGGFCPAWSPDDSKIYYNGPNNSEEPDAVSVMDFDGTNQQPIGTLGAYISLSPDGTKIVYYPIPGPNPNNYDIYVANVDGTNPVNLSDLAGPTGYESAQGTNVWGANGKILFKAQEPNWRNITDYRIWWMAEDGSASGVILNEANQRNGQPGWSPDETKIVFTSRRISGDFNIWTMDDSGSNLQQLTFDPSSDKDAHWGLVVDVNNAPTADAGPDQVVECSGPDGAMVILNGSGSYDPDSTPDSSDIVSFEWLENGYLLGEGEMLDYIFSTDVHTVVLRITDNVGETAEDAVEIIVEDTTPPEIDAAFIDAGDETYRTVYYAQDICDSSPVIKKAFIKACGDRHDVANWQLVSIDTDSDDDDCEVEWDDGLLEIETSDAFLKVVAKDEFDNVGKIKIFPPLDVDDGDDDGDDDDEDDGDDDGDDDDEDDDDDDDDD